MKMYRVVTQTKRGNYILTTGLTSMCHKERHVRISTSSMHIVEIVCPYLLPSF